MLPAYLSDRKFRHAVAVLIGTMVGVGLYGIPFAFARAGFWVGTLWLAALAGVTVLFNLIFAEVVLSTQGTHQVTGYINIWLGSWGRRVFVFTYALSMYGGLLAFIIIIGEFLHNILSNFIAVDPQLYSLVFAVVGSLMWLLRVRTIAAIEQALIVLYTAAIAIICVIGAPHIQWAHYTGWTPGLWYLPYGVLLFALAGMSAVPMQRQLLSGRERLIKPAIIVAVTAVAVLYLLFAFVIVGVSGDMTSPEAFAGLFGVLGGSVIIVGSVLGVLTIATSYIILGTALYETFRLDYRQPALTAWLVALVPPIVLFISGIRNFIDIIGLVGAVAVGVQGVLLLAAYLRARKMRLRDAEVRLGIPRVVVWLLMLFFLAGAVYALLF